MVYAESKENKNRRAIRADDAASGSSAGFICSGPNDGYPV